MHLADKPEQESLVVRTRQINSWTASDHATSSAANLLKRHHINTLNSAELRIV